MSERRDLSRAEMVRLRREKQNEQRLKRSSERAFRPIPPVTTRGVKPSAPKQKPRRFQIALSAPAIHLHAPTLPRVRAGWRLLSFLLSLILGAAIYLLWTLPTFRVGQAQVFGNARIPSAEIDAVIAMASQPIFFIQPDDLETRLRLNYPELAAVEIQVGLPNQLSARVSERQPVIFWQQGGVFTWIDSNGIAFRPRGEAPGLIPVNALGTPPSGAPLLNDPLSPVPYLSADLVKAIVTLAPYAPVGVPIIYDPQNGLGWEDGRGWQAFFGSDWKHMEMKARVYKALVESLTARGMYPALINVAHPEAPYYRMEQ